MILYTPLAESDIFPTNQDTFSNRHFISVQGKSMYVEQVEDGSYQLLQLLSTDPKDFLDENFLPGTKIT
ncbi:YlzJ-like family protein [Virgibacillus byunsanensis]|uniref:YlzJ-like family protein n=1 Tax=Virgibacillus byunsanensis TaxID=570945 RepID=A0ABW3LHR4_9BACI